MSKRLPLLIVIVILITASLYYYFSYRRGSARTMQTFAFLRDPAARPELRMMVATQCDSAPFIFPTDGLIGFIWDESFRPGHRHQGIDIFSGTEAGVTAVVAAYPGYFTCEADWKSTVIIRVPQDPLQPGRQLWV
jgi:hypothetical protein